MQSLERARRSLKRTLPLAHRRDEQRSRRRSSGRCDSVSGRVPRATAPTRRPARSSPSPGGTRENSSVLLTMMVQLQNEAASRPSITILTTTWADQNIDSSVVSGSATAAVATSVAFIAEKTSSGREERRSVWGPAGRTLAVCAGNGPKLGPERPIRGARGQQAGHGFGDHDSRSAGVLARLGPTDAGNARKRSLIIRKRPDRVKFRLAVAPLTLTRLAFFAFPASA